MDCLWTEGGLCVRDPHTSLLLLPPCPRAGNGELLTEPDFPRAHSWSAQSGKVKVAQLCPTLCDPMDCSPPGSSVHGSSRKILEWVAISFSRGSSQPKDRSCISCIGRWILYHLSHLGSLHLGKECFSVLIRVLWIFPSLILQKTQNQVEISGKLVVIQNLKPYR